MDRAAGEDAALAAARHGDLRAWEWLVGRSQELVFRSAYLAARDSQLAEAVTREVLTRAYRSLGAADVPSPELGADVRPWLLRLTDTVARSRLREMTHRRDARLPEPDPCPRIAASPVRLGPGTPRPTPAEHALLVESFDGLIDEDRITVAARYAFGLGRDAAATRLGVKPGAVDERLATALARLRRRAMGLLGAAPTSGPHVGPHPGAAGRIASLSDDQLGSMAMAAVISELPWTPDVARIVCERLAREAVAYPVTSSVPANSGNSTDRATGGTARGLAGEGARTPSVGRRAPSALRSVTLLVGISLVGVSFALSGGAVVGRGWELPVELRSSLGSVLGTSASPQEPRASDGPSPAKAPNMTVATTLDSTAPVPAGGAVSARSAPGVSVVGVRRLARGALDAVVRVHPQAPKVVRAQIERRVGDDAWTTDGWASAQDPLLAVLKPGTTYGLRVRTVDAAGGETVSEAAHVRLTVRGPRSGALIRSGGDWQLRPGPSGGPRLVAVKPGATLRTEFEGSDVALVGRDVAVQDPVSLRVDGGSWEANPRAGQQLGRWVLFSEDLDDGAHTVEVRAAKDGLGIDAVLILRTLGA